MEVVLSSGFNKKFVSCMKTLADIDSFVIIKIRAGEVSISCMNATMASFCLITIPANLFQEFRVSEQYKAVAIRLPVDELIKSFLPKGITQFSSIGISSSKDFLVLRLQEFTGAQITTKFQAEPCQFLKAEHPPLSEYPVKFVIAAEQLQSYIKSVGANESGDIQMDFDPKHGFLIHGPLRVTAKALVDPGDLIEFNCHRLTSILVNLDDLLCIVSFCEFHSTLISFYIDNSPNPLVIETTTNDGIVLKAVISILSPEENDQNSCIGDEYMMMMMSDCKSDIEGDLSGNSNVDDDDDIEIPATPEFSY